MSMILNPYRYAAAGGPTFGNASRSFNGSSDYIEMGSWTPRSEITIAAWVNQNAADSLLPILSVGGYYNSVSAFSFQIVGQRLRFSISNTDYSFIDLNPGLTGWHHLAVTYSHDLSSIAIYVDGSVVRTTLISGSYSTIPSSAASYRIGESLFIYADGKISDVREYDRYLDSSEIADLISGTHVSSGLVGWWLTNNDDVLDYSGNGNDGTNNGSTYSTDGPFD